MDINKLLTGFKTLIVSLLLIILPPVLQYLLGFDWRSLIPDNYVWASPMIVGIIMGGLRWFTKTAIFQKAQSVNPADPRLGGLQ